jgi:hypothetical protein
MHVLRSAPLIRRRHVLRGIGTALALTRVAASLLVGFVAATVGRAADPAAYVAKLEEFPPADAGVDLAGELVTVDHVNRRGGLRLDGDFSEDRYHSAPTFSFILMPYGMVSYQGAPADLHDVPLGTRLVGRCVLPPEGDTAIAPVPPQHKKHVPEHNRAIRLEDDFSHDVRTGRAWKLQAFDREKGQLTLVAVTAAGEPVPDAKPVTHSVDDSTRIWKGNGFGTLDDLAAATNAAAVVQANLTWAPGWENRQFHTSDIWLDDASQQAATARQRQIHIRRMKHYWLPARIDKVDHKGGGAGVLTITLLGGFDPSLYEAFFDNGGVAGRMSTGVHLAAAEPTLRTWWQNHDKAGGSVVKRRTVENPPLGSSGIELDITTPLLLEGFRPGRFVRVGSATGAWPNAKPPTEWRIQSIEERERGLYGPAPNQASKP